MEKENKIVYAKQYTDENLEQEKENFKKSVIEFIETMLVDKRAGVVSICFVEKKKEELQFNGASCGFGFPNEQFKCAIQIDEYNTKHMKELIQFAKENKK